MKKIQYILYICDDEIFFLNIKKDQIVKEKFKSIKEDNIINSDLFSNEFDKFLRKNHIKTTLFGENIIFIKNTNISPISQEKYQSVLKEYFRNIEFKNLETILKVDKDVGFLNISSNYIDYYFMKKNQVATLRVSLQLFNDNLNKTLHHLLTTIYKPKKIMVFGNHENIAKIAQSIEQNYNIKTTFPEIHYNYILKECKI